MSNRNQNVIVLIKSFLIMSFFFVSHLSLAEDTPNIVINNEAQSESTNQNVITAPALIPSQTDEMRNLRQKQEVNTEDSVLKELERQRILDERKRFHSIFNKEEEKSSHSENEERASAPPVSSRSLFAEKSFLTLGTGLMNYYNVPNINSTEAPTFLGSFGAYGYGGHLIFDTTFFYSTHYIKTPNKNHQNVREKLNEPGVAMAAKWSFLKGKMKPYVGLTAALIGRKWKYVARDGTDLDSSPEIKAAIKDIAKKSWHLSVNGGITFGADITLGERLGLNVDVRYYANLYTENRKIKPQANEDILDERDVVLGSLNLKYFFN